MAQTRFWQARWRIIKLAVASRLVMICLMSVSCALLPNFNPGDDVQKFDMRLETHDMSRVFESDSVSIDGHCVSFREVFCKPELQQDCSRILEFKPELSEDQEICALSSQKGREFRFTFYRFLLSPFTRWDAARFLNLALYPNMRDPKSIRSDGKETEGSRILLLYGDIHKQVLEDSSFTVSEQAHAFFPLFPFIVRWVALNITIPVFPAYILPPTLEAAFVLTGLLWNNLMFVIASILLFDLTVTITTIIRGPEDQEGNGATKKQGEEDSNINEIMSIWTLQCFSCESIAELVVTLFCLNPASVFFTTCYSEATFFTLTLLGHLLFRQCGRPTTSQFWKDLFLKVGATIYWTAAAYTRSNGVLIAFWILLQGLALTISLFVGKRKGFACVYVANILTCLATGASVMVPMIDHDRRGYLNHCAYNGRRPTWCQFSNVVERAGRWKKFSLYGYVQRKHWNVGLFRYYELKQIPNFLLAFPVLTLGFAGPIIWIVKSVHRHRIEKIKASNAEGHSNSFATQLQLALPRLFGVIFWAIDALGRACTPTDDSPNETKMTWTLIGPHLLSDYALLACGTILGATIAHVQISTRMIFSSFPAVYWFIAWLLTSEEGKRRPWLKKTIVVYFVSFNILGSIMHPTWLPWT